jgi:hypothetical protein
VCIMNWIREMLVCHRGRGLAFKTTECSETSAKFQTPGNYPKESIQHVENGVSLKSRMV